VSERKGEVLGLQSPSYGNTHRRAGFGSARVPRQGCRQRRKGNSTHTRGLPSAARLQDRWANAKGRCSGWKARATETHTQASRVRKCPGTRQGCRLRRKGNSTHTRGLPSAARL